jgi:hypothetical protein
VDAAMRVIVIKDFSSEATVDPSKLASGVECPRMVHRMTMSRKFLVVRNADELIFTVGPWLPVEHRYAHEAVVEWLAKYQYIPVLKKRKLFEENDSPAVVLGGGELQFSFFLDRGETCHHIVVTGKSGDYGVYDPVVLMKENRKVLLQALGERWIEFKFEVTEHNR